MKELRIINCDTNVKYKYLGQLKYRKYMHNRE